jgi:putative endonuclease
LGQNCAIAVTAAFLHTPVSFWSHFFINGVVAAGYGHRMTETPAQVLGRRGEQLALEHFERLGFVLVERNCRLVAGEIDLIVRDATTTVFAEVKTRRAGGFDPLLSLTAAKRRRMRTLAAAWLGRRAARVHTPGVRIDAVAVVVDHRDRLRSLEHFEDVA